MSALGKGPNLELPKKVEKVHNFLDPPPPSPGMFWIFLIMGKIGNFIIPPQT